MSKKAEKYLAANHVCELKAKSEGCLPRLPPTAGNIRRAFRKLRKLTLITRKNPACQQTIRSNAALANEERRHIRSSNWYVIHPFSRIAMLTEAIMALTWVFVFFKDPYSIAILPVDRGVNSVLYNISTIIADTIIVVYIIICFFTGKPFLNC